MEDVSGDLRSSVTFICTSTADPLLRATNSALPSGKSASLFHRAEDAAAELKPQLRTMPSSRCNDWFRMRIMRVANWKGALSECPLDAGYCDGRKMLTSSQRRRCDSDFILTNGDDSGGFRTADPVRKMLSSSQRYCM
jgi:hypothetical protein